MKKFYTYDKPEKIMLGTVYSKVIPCIKNELEKSIEFVKLLNTDKNLFNKIIDAETGTVHPDRLL